MAFDPDAYLAAPPSKAFDPDAYLASGAASSEIPGARSSLTSFGRRVAGEADVILGLPGQAVRGIAGLVNYAATRLPYVSEAGVSPGASAAEAEAARRQTEASVPSYLTAPVGTLTGTAGTSEYQGNAPTQILGLVNRVGIQPAKNLLASTGMPQEDANALVDTALNFAGGPIARGVGKVGGVVGRGVNIVRDLRSPDIQAGQIARAALGDNPQLIAQVQAANAAQPNVLPSQAAAALPGQLPAYQALLRAGEQTPLGEAAAARTAKDASHIEQLDKWAGGPTKTEQLATEKGGAESLRGVTTPMREEALAATTPEAQATKAAQASFEENQLRPLKAESLIEQLNSKLQNPEVKYNSQVNSALTRIRSMLQNSELPTGNVSGDALYAIRKNGVNSVIEEVSKDLSPAARQKFASAVLAKINPLFDDAIEKAGGTGWKDYLDTFSKGRMELDKQTLFGRLSDLYKTNKQAFVDAVEGNNPDLVHEVIGGGKYDIKEILGDKYAKLQQMADYIKSEQKIAGAARAGGAPLSKIMEQQNQPIVNRLVALVGGPKVELANRLIEGLRGSVSARVMSRVEEAAKSGQSMNDLLNTLPYSDRISLMKAYERTPEGSFFLNTLTGGALMSPSRNNLAPQQ